MGRIPAEKPPILQQLGVAGEGWVKLVASFHTQRGGLRRAIGRPVSLEAEAAKRGQRWIQGIALSREIVGQTSGDPSSHGELKRRARVRGFFLRSPIELGCVDTARRILSTRLHQAF